MLTVTEHGLTESRFVPIGSGTIVSPNGLILTNWHVVDVATHRQQLEVWQTQAAEDGSSLTLTLDAAQFLILNTGRGDVPEPVYRAEVVAEHHGLDLAVLQITASADGQQLDPAALALLYVPLGDSSLVAQGDPIHIFSYPAIAGGNLQYTSGVVSGFRIEDGIEGRAWITTDATSSGGSSGGTAVDDAGRLIGIPTQGSQLDCRPGDTNVDGRVDASDVGCIPVGGSFGQLRPINLAYSILAGAGLSLEVLDDAGTIELAPTEVPIEASTDGLADVVPQRINYVFAEDYCRTGPVYPPGTEIELPRDVIPWGAHQLNRTEMKGIRLFVYLPILPAGTTVTVVGPYVENGVCDFWPIRFMLDGTEMEMLIDEWELSPEVPNQVVPLPPERQTITRAMADFCLSNRDYTDGMTMVLADDTPMFDYRPLKRVHATCGPSTTSFRGLSPQTPTRHGPRICGIPRLRATCLSPTCRIRDRTRTRGCHDQRGAAPRREGGLPTGHSALLRLSLEFRGSTEEPHPRGVVPDWLGVRADAWSMRECQPLDAHGANSTQSSPSRRVDQIAPK